jgi:biopolymer transport protein ExbD
MVRSVIQQTAMSSPIEAASHISPNEGKNRKSLVAGLMITSLVDAFSILVIFLLASFSKSGEVLSLSKNMELPPASLSDELKKTTLIKLDSGKIFVEDKEVTIKSLIKILIGYSKASFRLIWK